MRNTILVFLLFISTVLFLPLSFSQVGIVDERDPCPASAAADICDEPFEPSELTVEVAIREPRKDRDLLFDKSESQ